MYIHDLFALSDGAQYKPVIVIL